MTDVLERTRQTLERTGATYEMMECDPALSDTVEFCAHYGYALEDSVNTILMKAKGSRAIAPYVACALLGHCRLDTNHTLRQKLEARRVSFASAQETREITGMELGSVWYACVGNVDVSNSSDILEAARFII